MGLLVIMWQAAIALQCDGVARTDTGQYPERVRVEIADGGVRIDTPDIMAPSVSGRGNAGWRELTDVSITDREISGRYSYNWINKPKVTINRMSGDIEIQASDVASHASFRGDCRPANSTPIF